MQAIEPCEIVGGAGSDCDCLEADAVAWAAAGRPLNWPDPPIRCKPEGGFLTIHPGKRPRNRR